MGAGAWKGALFMTKSIGLLLGTVTLGAAAADIGGLTGPGEGERTGSEYRGAVGSSRKNAERILEIFKAVEQRDERRFEALREPGLEIRWPPSLPYGRERGTCPPTWTETWAPLQPTEHERSMDPRVVAVGGDEVVVLWRQRGVSPAGELFDGEVLGLYRLHDGKLARAQMFYFDSAAVASFLARARP
jgi:ketosteroid isomerase-like protein